MLPPYRSPDKLPEYSFLHDEDDDEWNTSARIPNTSGEFYFVFYEHNEESDDFGETYGKMCHALTDELVGVLRADLIMCTPGSLYHHCDKISGQLLVLVRSFANPDGSLRKDLCTAIGDEARIRKASSGHILHLDEVHIKCCWRGRDLGLEFIFACFTYFVHRGVTLIASCVAPWDFADQEFNDWGSSTLDFETTRRTASELVRLYRYFARTGLQQLYSNCWFAEPSLLPRCPLTKEEVAGLQFLLPPRKVIPKTMSEQERTLQYAAEKAGDGGLYAVGKGKEALEKLRGLLESTPVEMVHASHALQFAVAAAHTYGSSWTSRAARMILEQSQYDVNHVDEDGQTALHIAAWTCSEAAVRLLLEHGADPLVQDRMGRYPHDVFVEEATSKREEAIVKSAILTPATPPCHAAAKAASKYLACSILLQLAEAARFAQRKTIVHSLMYVRGLTADALRTIVAKTATPPIDTYLSPTRLLAPYGSSLLLAQPENFQRELQG